MKSSRLGGGSEFRTEWPAPFIYAQGLRELVFQLCTLKDIEFGEQDEGTVVRVATHGG
jgi:hypothetical protein